MSQLQSWFKSLRIEIISDIHNGKYPLKKYDLVVYTCAHASEFEFVSSVDLNEDDWMRMLRIGQGPYDDDFNQIHFVKTYKTKCVDVVDETCYLQNQTQLILYGLALGTKTVSYRDSYFNYDLYFNGNAPKESKESKHTLVKSEKQSPFLRMLKDFSATKLVKKLFYQLNKIYLSFLLRRIQAAIVRSLNARAKSGHDEPTSDNEEDEMSGYQLP